jgi:hypothetical protein
MPDARIAYVDNDPMAARHTGALLAVPAGIAAVRADLSGPAAFLAEPGLREVIDPAGPVCLILGLVLHFMPADRAREVAAGYAAAIAPGSCVVISVGRNDDRKLWERVRSAYAAATLHNHTREQAAGFFDGLELVPPGLAVAQGWRGDWHDARVPGSARWTSRRSCCAHRRVFAVASEVPREAVRGDPRRLRGYADLVQVASVDQATDSPLADVELRCHLGSFEQAARDWRGLGLAVVREHADRGTWRGGSGNGRQQDEPRLEGRITANPADLIALGKSRTWTADD